MFFFVLFFVALSGVSESLALQLSGPSSVTLGVNVAVTWTRDSPDDPTSFNLRARSTSPDGPIGPPDPITTGADTTGTVVLVFHQTGSFVLDALDPETSTVLATSNTLNVVEPSSSLPPPQPPPSSSSTPKATPTQQPELPQSPAQSAGNNSPQTSPNPSPQSPDVQSPDATSSNVFQPATSTGPNNNVQATSTAPSLIASSNSPSPVAPSTTSAFAPFNAMNTANSDPSPSLHLSPTSAPDSSPSTSSNTKMMMILGASIAGAVVILVLVLFFVWRCWKGKRKRTKLKLPIETLADQSPPGRSQPSPSFIQDYDDLEAYRRPSAEAAMSELGSSDVSTAYTGLQSSTSLAPLSPNRRRDGPGLNGSLYDSSLYTPALSPRPSASYQSMPSPYSTDEFAVPRSSLDGMGSDLGSSLSGASTSPLVRKPGPGSSLSSPVAPWMRSLPSPPVTASTITPPTPLTAVIPPTPLTAVSFTSEQSSSTARTSIQKTSITRGQGSRSGSQRRGGRDEKRHGSTHRRSRSENTRIRDELQEEWVPQETEEPLPEYVETPVVITTRF